MTTAATATIANVSRPEVVVRSVEEAWSYLMLRRAEIEGRISGLSYEPCKFNLGQTSAGRQSTYTPDFWFIDNETHCLVVLEVAGYHKPRERARGDVLLRAKFPWIEFRTVDGKLIKNPRATHGVDPFFGLSLPIALDGVFASVAGKTLSKRAEAKFLHRTGRHSDLGDEITLTARECGEGEPVHLTRRDVGWRRDGDTGTEEDVP